MTRDDTLALLTRFCAAHSPSGHDAEIDPLLAETFAQMGYDAQVDAAGNLFALRPGRGQGRAIITAHKDELGVIVKRIDHDGRLQVRPVGAVWPWAYGEGPMDVLGDDAVVPGVLCFGSRHTSEETPGFLARSGALTWEMAWIETFLTPPELDAAGVHIGSKAVVARERKKPVLMGNYVAAYSLDDKAALVALFDILDQLALAETRRDVVFAVTAREELGGVGASWLAARNPADVMLALEVAPVADEYHTLCDERPVVLMQDDHTVYDERLARELATAAGNLGIGLQYACVSGFGSDASFAARRGHVGRAACLGFATENTHGFEIAHLGGLLNLARLSAEWLRSFG
jgi:putative aminopeptidase FrvX